MRFLSCLLVPGRNGCKQREPVFEFFCGVMDAHTFIVFGGHKSAVDACPARPGRQSPATAAQSVPKAKTELEAGRSETWLNNQAVLRDYPLSAYLAYDALTLRLPSASNSEVEGFFKEYPDLPQLRWMKLRWLRLLADRNEWPLFFKHYQPELNFNELDCLAGQGLLATGKHNEAFDLAEKLWLSSQSQPNACDPCLPAGKTPGCAQNS